MQGGNGVLKSFSLFLVVSYVKTYPLSTDPLKSLAPRRLRPAGEVLAVPRRFSGGEWPLEKPGPQTQLLNHVSTLLPSSMSTAITEFRFLADCASRRQKY